MAISNTKRVRLEKRFREQIGFIERSSRDFDEGFEEEGVRIATAIRVIFHQTQQSTSLISHLSLSGNKMLSSGGVHNDWKDYLNLEIDLSSPQPVKMRARKGEKFHELAVKDWWESETVFVHEGVQYHRKEIILHAANKDGGAHVDTELKEFYVALSQGIPMPCLIGNLTYEGKPPFEQGVDQHTENAHLAIIRQFAHECLTSFSHFKWP